MTKSRIVLRVVLMLMFVPILWVGYRGYVAGNPAHLRKQAEAALAAGDLQTARLCLQKLLQASPQDAAAHATLAEIGLADSKAAGQPATYAAHPEALAHLEEAARLDPGNTAWQERLLAAYLEAGHVSKAAEVAEGQGGTPLKTADALYALLWRSVEQRNVRKAEETFYAFADLPSDKAFQGMALIAKAYRDAGQPDQMQGILSRLARLASVLDERQLGHVTGQDRAVMLQELCSGVEQAADPAAAVARMEALAHACERLAAGELESPAKLGEIVSEAMIRLESRFPQPGDAAAQAARRKLQERVSRLTAASLASGQATPVTVYQSAVSAFQRGDVETGLKTIRQGLTAVAEGDTGAVAQAQALRLLGARQLVMRGRFGEAKPYLESLLNSPELAGWGALLSGAVALGENRVEASLDYFRRAQRSLGNTPLVRMALAKANLQLERWQDALDQLSALHLDFSQLDEEQRLWAERYLGSGAKVRYDELRARLGLNQWQQAQALLDELRGTEYSPRARLMYLSFLWRSGRAAQADALLAEMRRQDPYDFALVQFEVSLRERQGQGERAVRSLGEYLRANPGHLGGQLLLCEYLLRHERYDEARQQLERLDRGQIDSARDRLSVAVLEGHTQLRLGSPERALELLLTAHLDNSRTSGWPVAQARRNPAALAREPGDPASGEPGEIRRTVFDQLDSGGSEAVADPVAGESFSDGYAAAIQSVSGAVRQESLENQLVAAVRQCLSQISQRQQTEQITARLESWRQQQPDDPLLLEVTADLEIRQGRYDSAIALLDRLELLHPEDPYAACLKAKAWLGKQQPDQARAELDRALRRDAGHVPSLLLLAQMGLLDKQYSEALDQANRILRDNPGTAAAYLVKADALTGLAREQEAVLALEDLIRRNPRVPGAYLALGRAYEQAKRPDDAARVYASGRRSLGGQATLALAIAEIRVLTRTEREEAAQALAREVADDATDAGTSLAVGRAFLEAGALGPARHWAGQALERAAGPQQASAHLLMGETALWQAIHASQSEQYETARDHFANVLRLEPENFAAANNLAWILAVRFGQAEEAARLVDHARSSLQVAQMPIEFLDTLTYVYRQTGRLTDAREVLDQAVSAHPGMSLLHFHLGTVLAELKEPDAARRALREAVRLGLSTTQEQQANKLLAQIGGTPAS